MDQLPAPVMYGPKVFLKYVPQPGAVLGVLELRAVLLLGLVSSKRDIVLCLSPPAWPFYGLGCRV